MQAVHEVEKSLSSMSSSSSSDEDSALEEFDLKAQQSFVEGRREGQSWWTSHPLGSIPYLAWRLFWEISGAPAWVLRFLRLVTFAVALWSGFHRCIRIYAFSPTVVKNVRYGPNQRNYLDIYLPQRMEDSDRVPVVVFVSGGAWIIGYKAWGFLVARCLNRFGYVVVTPDYRNYPQASIGGMVEDLHCAMRWVFQEIHRFGGDAAHVSLCGQSAGAQLVMMVTLEQAKLQANVRDGSEPAGWDRCARWPVQNLDLVFGLSGPYQLFKLKEHLKTRGVHEGVIRSVFGGDSGLHYYSPELQVQRATFRSITPLLPRIALFHGLVDNTVSHASTLRFYEALREQEGVRVVARFYDQMTHSGPLVEDLMDNEPTREDWVRDFVAVLRHLKPSSSQRLRKRSHLQKSVCVAPWRMWCARWVNPF